MYTELRMLVEAVFEGLPSALVSTAVLYDKLGLQSTVYAIPTAVLCLSLASSFFRGALEVWRLAVLTHEEGNWCFVTTLVDMVWDMLPSAPPNQPPEPQFSFLTPAQGAASASAAPAAVTVAPVQMTVQQQSAHPNAGLAQSGKPPRPAISPRMGHIWVVLWTWFEVLFFGVVTVLLCISIGCVGLLVQDGSIKLMYLTVPRYRFGGDANCGAGSVFAALHSGPRGGSCTLPNLAAV
jgi:hypothetical protein